MSEDYFSKKGKQPARRDAGRGSPQDDTAKSPSDHKFMAVGSGTTSQHSTRLMNMIEKDSGYGGSVPDEDHPGLTAAAGNQRPHRQQTGAIHQMWYNSQRSKLSRSINLVLELLDSLRDINAAWPAHYPSVQRTVAAEAEDVDSSFNRPGLSKTDSFLPDNRRGINPAKLRRSLTSVEDHIAESSRAAENRTAAEPRLVSPQIAQEFSILKLDLKLGALHQAELVHSLEKSSIASLLDGKISSSMKHLLALRERIADTSSKVLITGDLNAGKSTFCNALLRRKVLPEDQQPCTAIFCEVLDARENAGIEEVHAVHKDATYDRNDESTYDVFSLKELENIVIDNEAYTQCKIYVRDSRSIDESLLNNGVVDIALIDAPGLNSDTTKTTAIFARQEEIDVVVFVLSAANHFTQSAQEFILAAAAEKAYIFIVVNGFDFIRDKERCKKIILNQVAGLSPRTHKESSELVHFVSSNAIPAPPGGPSGGGGGDPSDDDDKGKGKDADKVRDFEALEQSLRRFVLEKRARSKLAPARTYLLNILNDMNTLSTVNRDVAQAELERVTAELKELEPELETRKKARSEVSDRVDRGIEETCQDVYEHSRAELTAAIRFAGNTEYDVVYPGFLSAFQYAEELKDAMLSHIAESVTQVEEYARKETVRGVNTMKQLGILHVGDEFKNLTFRSDVMFRRKKDALARDVHIPTELLDFVDWSTLMQRQEKYAGTGMALTVAGAVVPRMIGMGTWMDQALAATRLVGNENLRHLIIPGIIVAAFAASAYIVQQIPNSLPRRLAAKISSQLTELDYVHANSSRITTSVRRVLRVPADNLRVGLEQTVKDLDTRREDTIKVKGESERASDFFRSLVKRSSDERHVLEAMDLDAPPPGVD